MDIYTESFVIFAIVCFPLLLCTLYILYNRTLGKSENLFFEDLAIILAIYLIIRLKGQYSILLISIPLLTSYIDKRKFTSLITTVVLFCYTIVSYKFNVMAWIFEYIILYVSYLLYYFNKINNKNLMCNDVFIIVFFFCFFTNSIKLGNVNAFYVTDAFLITIIYLICICTFGFLYEKCHKIVKLRLSIKEIEESKQI